MISISRPFLPASASLRISPRTWESSTNVSKSSRTDSTWTFSLINCTVLAPSACHNRRPLPLGGFTETGYARLLDAAHQRGMKLIYGMGLYSWGYEAIIAA